MAALVPGTGGDIKATTIEQGLLEMAMRLQLAERNPTSNPDAVNNLTFTINTDTSEATITATIPLTQAVDPATGAPTFVADPYLV